VKLRGTLAGGTAFTVTVDKRTRGVHLNKLDDPRAFDLEGIEVARSLRTFECSSVDGPIRFANLERLAELPRLEDLQLHVGRGADLGVLARCGKIARLDLTLRAARTLDARWIGELKKLRHLSLTFEGAAPVVDLPRLPKLEVLILSNAGNAELTLPPRLIGVTLEGMRLLRTVRVPPSLRWLTIVSCPRLRALDVSRLRRIEDISLIEARALELDLTAAPRSLKEVHIDGSPPPYVSGPIESPALRRPERRGGLRR
jgi:hypothetical protein